MAKKKADPADSIDLSSDELMCLAIMDIQVAVANLCETGDPEYCYGMIRKSMQELKPLAEAVSKKLNVKPAAVPKPEKLLENIIEFREREEKEKSREE